MATSYNNIGFVYERLGIFDTAVEYYSKSLEAIRKVVSAEGGDPKQVEGVYFTSFVIQ